MTPRNRRIDRVTDPSFVEGLGALSLDEVRHRRDECLAEREYLSMLRRLLQGRAEILKDALSGRDEGDAALIERLTAVLADDEHAVSPRGEAVRVSVPEDEMLLARRRVERLVADVELSDPRRLDDATLRSTIETLVDEEREVSASRRQVLDALDALQDELKRRYKDDPSLALR